MMQLSPKAMRFIIEALEHYQTHHEGRLRDDHVTEEEAADPTNAHQYLNQSTEDWYTHAASFGCSSEAMFSTAAVTVGS